MAEATKRGPGRPRKVTAPVAEAAPTPIVSQEEPTVILPDPEDEGLGDYELSEAETKANTPAPVTQDMLAQAIVQLAESQKIMTESTVRRIPFANFKPRSSFNPTGNKRRKLKRRCYQNGFPMNIVLLHDKEIEALNVLKAGKYLNGLVTVRVDEKGEDTTLNILYKNKSADDKLALKDEFRSLGEFLTRAIKEGPMEE